jgi:hypothetical protein
MASRKHADRFARWCRLGGPRLQLLADQVETTLLPFWLSAGFLRCDTYPGESEPVSAQEIVLARLSDDQISCVTFIFDKYHRPAFQVNLLRGKIAPPHQIMIVGNLVARPSRHLQFWGKPWWWPTSLWPALMTRKQVARVAARQADALVFMETGVRSRAISKDWRE